MKCFIKVSVMFFLLTCYSFSEALDISKLEIDSPGEVIILKLDSEDYKNFFVKLDYGESIVFPFYPYGNKIISLVSLPIEVKREKVKIEVFKGDKIIFSNFVKLNYLKDMYKRKARIVKLTKESKSILANTERILSDIRYIYSKITNIDFYSFYGESIMDFSFPSTNRITSPFGIPRKYPNKVRYHKGIDFSKDPDDNVYSVGKGIVIISSNFLANGETVYIYHGYGIVTSYFHLSTRFVKENDFVSKGQVIGKIGQTGIVTGPHLHFGIYLLNLGGYVAVDYLSFLNLGNSKLFAELGIKKSDLD